MAYCANGLDMNFINVTNKQQIKLNNSYETKQKRSEVKQAVCLLVYVDDEL